MRIFFPLSLLCLMLWANTALFAQDEAKPADPDPAVLEKIVKIALTDQFKPADEPKYVYLPKQLKLSASGKSF